MSTASLPAHEERQHPGALMDQLQAVHGRTWVFLAHIGDSVLKIGQHGFKGARAVHRVAERDAERAETVRSASVAAESSVLQRPPE